MIYYIKDLDKLTLQIIGRWEEKYNLKCKNTKSGVLSFAGKILVKWVLNEKYGIAPETCIIVKDEHGKPYIEDIPYKFSISHSKTIAAVAISEENIGMDIQKFPDYSEKLAERICSESELKEIKMSENKTQTLAAIWTRKESYIKFYGNKKWDKINKIPSDGCQTVFFEENYAASVLTTAEFDLKTVNVDWGRI